MHTLSAKQPEHASPAGIFAHAIDIPPPPSKMHRSTFNSTHTMALAPSTNAPDFTLKTLGPEGLADFSLSSNFGKKPTVILFFPLAFTGVCTQELCDVTAGLSKYEELNASVVGISVDSPFSQDAWAKKENIRIPLLSDLNKETAKAYGVFLEDLIGLGGTSARAAFVVDKDGVIRHSEQTPTPKDLPDFHKITEVLASL